MQYSLRITYIYCAENAREYTIQRGVNVDLYGHTNSMYKCCTEGAGCCCSLWFLNLEGAALQTFSVAITQEF